MISWLSEIKQDKILIKNAVNATIVNDKKFYQSSKFHITSHTALCARAKENSSRYKNQLKLIGNRDIVSLKCSTSWVLVVAGEATSVFLNRKLNQRSTLLLLRALLECKYINVSIVSNPHLKKGFTGIFPIIIIITTATIARSSFLRHMKPSWQKKLYEFDCLYLLQLLT